MTHQIKISPTSDTTIIKFESNHFLTKHESFEFANIDQAKQSPLAQELFYLPFVKTIYIAQNFVAIQRYDIVEWNDVQEAVASQIETYLNSGKEVIISNDVSGTKKVPISVYAESTPNPRVRKFVANKKISLKPVEFKQASDANPDSLPAQLFSFPFVEQVFSDDNYISISVASGDIWDEVTMELRDFIRIKLQDGATIGNSTAQATQTAAPVIPETKEIDLSKLDSISQQVVGILDEYVKPAVAGDGGNIQFDSYDANTKTVKVILQGACSGCPSSTATLKNGIEAMMRDMLAGHVETVEAING